MGASKDLHILPVVFRLMRGEVLPIDECRHVFFKDAVKEGILVENRDTHTIRAKRFREERYNYMSEKYGFTLLNFTCRYFDEHEDVLLIKYWAMLHGNDLSRRDEVPVVLLNNEDENSIILRGKLTSIWSATKGTLFIVETKVNYTKLNGDCVEDFIDTRCIIPGKEYRMVQEEIGKGSNILIKGHFRSERGEYQFFNSEEVNVIVDEYVKLDYDGDLKPEDGDECFFIDRSETDSDRSLNKVILTGKVSNIGFKLTRGYPHITLHLRTKSDCEKGYVEFPIEIWEKHFKDCFKDINVGDSIMIEGYFRHPIFNRYYYCYESIDATVFAYKYKILSHGSKTDM